MCGIAGIISKYSIDDISDRMSNMVISMRHRGPNNQSIEILDDKKYAFGHSRLSIIDLDESSNQPMYSKNKEWLVVFNGEIFNFEEIKKELKCDFVTKGDTEVILESVSQKGLEWFLKKANGMFAMALYNLSQKKIYLIRDRFSIKPLFYTIQNQTLIFASEIKAILKSGIVDAKFNDSAIDEYLGYRMVREPFTFFKDIFQVCGGEYLAIDSELKIENKKYYFLPSQNFDTEFDEKILIEKTTYEVEEAIKRWSIADVKVGAYLSGGVDSSLTSAVLATNRENKEDLHTYTIGFEDNNEFEFSKIVAEKYGIDHKNILIDKDTYLKEWDRLIEYNDAPLAVPNEIPLAIMSTELSKDITVVISGEGADELFGGYGKIYRLPYDYQNHVSMKTFYEEFIEKYEYVPRKLRDKYLKTCVDYRTYFDTKLSNEFEKYCNEENVFRFFQTYHIKGLLKRVDMTTMQASVEARPPFLDHELIEFVNTRIPYDLKLKWISAENKEFAKEELAKEYSENRDIPKYILKKVSEKYLPNEIIYRKKVGFPVPLSQWYDELTHLANEFLKNAEWLCQDKLADLLRDAKEDKRSGQILWMFINIEMFKKKYFDKNWRY